MKVSILKGLVFGMTIISFFSLMSKLDFIVHRNLYDYGLQFSYEWALEYWTTYTTSFIAFAIAISITYLLASNKTNNDLKVSAALFLTVNALMIGGLQDVMFYMLWGGGLPPNNVVWWWSPWRYLVGTWTSLTQIILTTLMTILTTFMWMLTIKR